MRFGWFSCLLKGSTSVRPFYSDNGILYVVNTSKKPFKSKETTQFLLVPKHRCWEGDPQPLWWPPSKLLIWAQVRFQTLPKATQQGSDHLNLPAPKYFPKTLCSCWSRWRRGALLASRWPLLWGSLYLLLPEILPQVNLESGKNMNRSPLP